MECDYKASVYANLSKKDELVKEVYEIEKECCDGCDLILTVTDEDLRKFQSVYGVDKNKLLNLSSGYEWESCDFVLPETRSSNKNSDGSLNKEQYKASAFFISGSHEPGVKAAKLIIEIARSVPSVLFIIAGSVKKGLGDLDIPENVEILGIIDNLKKEEFLKSCDMALNSTEHGSGLNIKMLEYFAFGIPVITTKFGARGLNVTNGKEVIIADSSNFGQAIEDFHNQSMEYKNSLASNARQYVIESFTWRNSAEKIVDYIKVNNIFEYSDEFSYDERELLQIRKSIYLYHTQEYIKYIFARMDNEDVFLWGASEAGKRVLSLLKGYNKKCCGFIDNNPYKWGEEFCGVPIMSPDKYINEYPNTIVIISSMYVPEIYKQLMNMGVERVNILINTLLPLACKRWKYLKRGLAMSSGRKKILAVNLYHIFPPSHGGQLAIWGLYKNLAKWFDVEFVNLTHNVYNLGAREISDYLLNTSLSKLGWRKIYDEFNKSELDGIVEDSSILVAKEFHKDKYVTDGIKRAAENAEIIITEHPYTYRIIKSACPDKTIWYRAHNVECNYKASVYDKLSNKDALVREITEIERECCEGSELILTATENDYNDFQSIYGIDSKKLLNISSGYEWESCDFVLPETRSSNKNSDGSLNKEQYKASAFFISGSHEPGVKAAKLIIEIARSVPSVLFIIAGNVKKGLYDLDIPENVEILGIIDNLKKEELLKSCDMALNSTEHGSGLNIKMLEYFAFGIPVITTQFGARGLNISNGKEAVIVDCNNFGKAIEEFYNQSIEYKDNLANNAREYLINNFTWRNNAKRIVDYIKYNRIFEFNDSERSLVQVRKPVNMYNDEKYMEHILTRMDNQQILLWGTGEGGKRRISLLESFGKKCCGFIDNNHNKWGGEFQGYSIISPKEYVEKYSDAIVIIASMYVYEIYKQLRELGCKRENILTSTWNLLNEEVDSVRVI